jgi:hypothetical protein
MAALEPVDVFADGLSVFMGTYGCALHFSLSTEESHKTTPPNQILSGPRIATIRVTAEFAKSMVFYLRQHVRRYESENGEIVIPPPALQRLVGEEQQSWDQLWGYTK